MNRTILITGSGTGLGLSLVKKFLSENWSVVAHYYEESAEFKQIKKSDKLIARYSNFLETDSLNELLKEIEGYNISALINNAGVYDFSKCSADIISSVENVLKINTIAPVLIAKQVMEGMKKRKFGHIINIGSIGVKYGSNIDSIFYSVSKSGLETATKSLAREGAGYNVLVNTIRPGVIDTEFFRSLSKDEEARKKIIPLKRFAQADEVSDLAFFLCTKNTYITNEILSISGGE